MDQKTSKYSWVILALTNPQFALDFPCHGPRKHKWGARCGSLRHLQGFKSSQPQLAQIQPLSCLFCLGRLDELLEIAPFLIIVDFSKTSDTYFSFCWIKDAANGSWFTSDWMDLAEWFNSSPAAGCRKILSHFTERMFSLSFLVITYLHELAQLGGSGGSCVAPSVCISYHWFGGQIIKPRIT